METSQLSDDDYLYRLQCEYELRLRELRSELESSFRAFIKWIFPIIEGGTQFIFQEHHDIIIPILEDVYAGKETRVVFNVPPGYGKTEVIIILFCCWTYAKQSRCRNLHLSYSDDLVSLNSVKIKNIIQTEEYQELWPRRFSPSVNGKGHWMLVDERCRPLGEFRAVSTAGGVTGFRAGKYDVPEESEFKFAEEEQFKAGRTWPDHWKKWSNNKYAGALLIDDPIKPDDALSDTKRKKINNLLSNTVKSRLMKSTTPVVMVMQRVHEDDPTGYLERGETGDDFKIVNIPAIMDQGLPSERALWPDKDPLDSLKAFELKQPKIFASQYMGNPTPDDGIFFKREWFRRFEMADVPAGEDFGAYDLATTDDAGDFTEMGVFRITPQGEVYIIDWWKGQTNSSIWIEQQLDFAKLYRIFKWAGESGPIWKSVEPWLKRRMIEKKTHMKMEIFPHSEANKEQNARGFQALAANGRVHMPNTQWANDLIDQLCKFPDGLTDDGVDCCSLFAKMYHRVWAKEQKPKEEASQPAGFTINQLVAEQKKLERRRGR